MEFKTNYVIYPRVQTKPEGNSRTKQSFQDETNINNILAKYEKTGVIEHMQQHGGEFLDLPSGLDYQTAMNIAVDARNAFDGLPGTIRAKFQNDPKTFFEFMEDPENEDEIFELGLKENTDPQDDSVPEPPPVVEPAPDIEPPV